LGKEGKFRWQSWRWNRSIRAKTVRVRERNYRRQGKEFVIILRYRFDDADEKEEEKIARLNFIHNTGSNILKILPFVQFLKVLSSPAAFVRKAHWTSTTEEDVRSDNIRL